MKKSIIIFLAIILLAVIAFNVGRLMARKVFEGDEDVASGENQIVEKENTIEVQENNQEQTQSETTT